DVVRVLRGEEEHAVRGKQRRVWIADIVRKRVLGDLAGLRIELADVPLRVGREPQVAVGVEFKTVRAGRRRLERVLLHLARPWIQSAKYVRDHPRPPDRPARTGFGIVRPRSKARRDPFLEADRDGTRNDYRLRSGLRRETPGQIVDDGIALWLG